MDLNIEPCRVVFVGMQTCIYADRASIDLKREWLCLASNSKAVLDACTTCLQQMSVEETEIYLDFYANVGAIYSCDG